MKLKHTDKQVMIPQENSLETGEPDWVSAKTNMENSSKETFLGRKEGRWHGVGEVVVPWVNFWFSFFCVNRITCSFKYCILLHIYLATDILL